MKRVLVALIICTMSLMLGQRVAESSSVAEYAYSPPPFCRIKGEQVCAIV